MSFSIPHSEILFLLCLKREHFPVRKLIKLKTESNQSSPLPHPEHTSRKTFCTSFSVSANEESSFYCPAFGWLISAFKERKREYGIQSSLISCVAYVTGQTDFIAFSFIYSRKDGRFVREILQWNCHLWAGIGLANREWIWGKW